MRRYNNSVITATGTAVAGALVVVKVAASPPGTGTLATIYSDDGITPTSNPLIADTFGRFGFNAPNGRYDLVVSGPNLITFVMAGEEITDFLEFQAGKDQQPSTGAIVSVPTSTQIISGTLNTYITNTVRYISPGNPQGWPGTDVGAWITNASIAGTPCEIHVGAGTYNFSTSIVPNSNVILQGAGSNATIFNWTGSSSGSAIFLPSTGGNITLRDFLLQNSGVAGTSTGIKIVNNSNILIERVVVNNFQTNLRSTGDGVSSITNGLVITDSFFGGSQQSYNLFFDHTANGVITNVQAGGALIANVVFDSNSQGFTTHWLNIFLGAAGIIFRCAGTGGSGTCGSLGAFAVPGYDYPPWGFQFDQCIVDAISTNDTILFDSSLGANALDMKFTDIWATGGANAIHISGGQKLTFAGGGTVRGSNGNGFLIDSSNVSHILIDGLQITNNNLSATADKHGIYITAATSDITIRGNHIYNFSEPFGNGAQQFGVKVAANVPRLTIVDNNLNGNVLGPLSYNSTAPDFVLLGNLPANTTGLTFATLPAATNGTWVYCQDCTAASPCTGSGTGAFAKRLNNVWVCN